MTRRTAGPSHTPQTRKPHVLPIGHLSTKSSVYSPVSMSRMSQDLVYNHMKSHYQRISSAKACVDTSAPKSMKLTIKEKDRKRKEALLASSIVQKTSLRSRDSNSSTEPSNSPRTHKINSSTLNHGYINDTGRTSLGKRWKDDKRASFTESPRRCGKFLETRRENGNLQQPHLKLTNLDDNFPANDSINEHYKRTRRRTDKDHQPQMDDYKELNSENTRTSGPNITDTSDIHPSSPHYQEEWSNIRNEKMETNFEDNEYHSSDRFYVTSTPRFERQDDFEMNPNLSLSTTTFSYKSPPSRRRHQLKKSAGEIIWTEEQKYLQFISDVTSDVLARGICSNRVINKVFESHIEKRKDDLDEENMREMINQLKEDLGVTYD